MLDFSNKLHSTLTVLRINLEGVRRLAIRMLSSFLIAPDPLKSSAVENRADRHAAEYRLFGSVRTNARPANHQMDLAIGRLRDRLNLARQPGQSVTLGMRSSLDG
jgi:hypothetical protein